MGNEKRSEHPEIGCANCAQRIDPEDHFCRACGQEVLGDDARRFGHLVRKSFAVATDLDGRLWRSLVGLLLRPGVLSRNYRLGQRRRYLSPISLFLLANLLFFLAPPLSDFSVALYDQYSAQPYSSVIAPWIDAELERTGRTFATFSADYELKIAELAKLMVILHVPLLALVSLLLTIDKRFFYADHVVTQLHFFAFLMLYGSVMERLLNMASGGLQLLIPGSAQVVALVLGVVVPLVYVPVMLRSAFDLGWWRALLTTPVFILGLFLVHFIFRLVQFLVGFSLARV